MFNKETKNEISEEATLEYLENIKSLISGREMLLEM
jgi:hypothetical protein